MINIINRTKRYLSRLTKSKNKNKQNFEQRNYTLANKQSQFMKNHKLTSQNANTSEYAKRKIHKIILKLDNDLLIRILTECIEYLYTHNAHTHLQNWSLLTKKTTEQLQLTLHLIFSRHIITYTYPLDPLNKRTTTNSANISNMSNTPRSMRQIKILENMDVFNVIQYILQTLNSNTHAIITKQLLDNIASHQHNNNLQITDNIIFILDNEITHINKKILFTIMPYFQRIYENAASNGITDNILTKILEKCLMNTTELKEYNNSSRLKIQNLLLKLLNSWSLIEDAFIERDQFEHPEKESELKKLSTEMHNMLHSVSI